MLTGMELIRVNVANASIYIWVGTLGSLQSAGRQMHTLEYGPFDTKIHVYNKSEEFLPKRTQKGAGL